MRKPQYRILETPNYFMHRMDFDVYVYPTPGTNHRFHCATFATLSAARSYIARQRALAVTL